MSKMHEDDPANESEDEGKDEYSKDPDEDEDGYRDEWDIEHER